MISGGKHQGIIVQISRDFKGIDVSLQRLKKLVKTVCLHFGLSKVTVSIAIVADAQFRKLNKQFSGRKGTSDCLSFDLSDGRPRSLKLFEIIVNGEKAIKEAKLRGLMGEAELALYITHGLLHNLGFDDSTIGSAKKMHDAEDRILRQLGYGFVYNKGAR